jgi:LysR family transcriptional activator of nhaA
MASPSGVRHRPIVKADELACIYLAFAKQSGPHDWSMDNHPTGRGSKPEIVHVEWLNYHHLLYFWLVVSEGTVARASRSLRLAQSTVSGQIRVLEASLGEPLLRKKGRHLEMTEMGQVVFAHAEEIFRTGRELLQAVKGRPTGRPTRLAVGVADVVPKLVAYRVIEPALRLGTPVQLRCEEGKTEALLAQLATHALDLVLTDQPVPASMPIRAYSHLLSSGGVSFFASASLRERLVGSFPSCLDGQPMLVPTPGSQLRGALERFFRRHEIAPRIVAEFEDSALLKAFGERGEGVFAGPTVIAAEIQQHYQVAEVGRVDEIEEKFYAVTVERRISHPAVMAIEAAARAQRP